MQEYLFIYLNRYICNHQWVYIFVAKSTQNGVNRALQAASSFDCRKNMLILPFKKMTFLASLARRLYTSTDLDNGLRVLFGDLCVRIRYQG